MKRSELKPLEVNGITAVTLGTFLWAIALIIMLISRNWLEQNGHLNWIWISSSGLILGLLGYRYTTNRVRRLVKKSENDQSKLIHDFE
jgi:Protein of unknown function (DUF2530)